MTIQNRILAATTTALLILTGASALATADTIPEGPFGPHNPFAKDANGIPTAKPVNASFAIPAHSSGAGIARCQPGTTAQGISLTGPVTRHEAELMQKNPAEVAVKAFL